MKAEQCITAKDIEDRFGDIEDYIKSMDEYGGVEFETENIRQRFNNTLCEIERLRGVLNECEQEIKILIIKHRNERIKPCPICGEHVMVNRACDNRFFIECSNCTLTYGMVGIDRDGDSTAEFETEDETIDSWNDRRS